MSSSSPFQGTANREADDVEEFQTLESDQRGKRKQPPGESQENSTLTSPKIRRMVSFQKS